MASSTLFRIIDDIKLLSHSWGGEVGIYNCTSGETHLLEAHAALVLQALKGEGRSKEFLLDYLADISPSSSSGELEEYLETALSQFRTMGLIEKCGGGPQ